MTDYAACAAGWLQTIGVDKPHLAGISWGSTLALQVFERHPQLSASLILVGAYAGWAGSLPADEVQRRLDAILAELGLPPEQWADNYVPTMVTPSASPELREEIRAAMLDTRADGAEPMLRAMAEADLRDVLPTVNVPTLLLYGEKDVRSSLEVAYEMHESIPTSVLHVIPGAGHMCNAEKPDEFNRHVSDWVRSMGSTASIQLEP